MPVLCSFLRVLGFKPDVYYGNDSAASQVKPPAAGTEGSDAWGRAAGASKRKAAHAAALALLKQLPQGASVSWWRQQLQVRLKQSAILERLRLKMLAKIQTATATRADLVRAQLILKLCYVNVSPVSGWIPSPKLLRIYLFLRCTRPI